MVIDDTSEKLRRNLLVISFAIVTGTFLNLSFQNHGTIFSTIDLRSVSPFKFWIVISITLIYAFYRYWFDSHTESAIQLFKYEYNSIKHKYLNNILNNDICTSLTTSRAPKFIIQYQEITDPHILEFNSQFSKPIKVTSKGYLRYVEGKSWEGEIGNTYTIQWSGNSFSKNGGESYKILIPNLTRNILRCKILIKIVSYSKSISELMIPIILFISALLICFYKLIQNYFEVINLNTCWI